MKAKIIFRKNKKQNQVLVIINLMENQDRMQAEFNNKNRRN